MSKRKGLLHPVSEVLKLAAEVRVSGSQIGKTGYRLGVCEAPAREVYILEHNGRLLSVHATKRGAFRERMAHQYAHWDSLRSNAHSGIHMKLDRKQFADSARRNIREQGWRIYLYNIKE